MLRADPQRVEKEQQSGRPAGETGRPPERLDGAGRALQVDLDPLDAVHSRLNHGLDVQDLLGGLHLAGHGAQAGVAGGEYGAAVLVGEDGGLKLSLIHI